MVHDFQFAMFVYQMVLYDGDIMGYNAIIGI